MMVGIGELSYVQNRQMSVVAQGWTSLVLQLEETPSKTPNTYCPELKSVNSSVKSFFFLFSL